MMLAEKSAGLRNNLRPRFARLAGFFRIPKSELPLHLGRISQAAIVVDETAAEIEARFLEISATVENTTTTGRELVELGEALTSLALGQGGGEICIDETARHIWHSIKYVEQCISESDQLIGRLVATSEQLNQLLAAEKNLERTLAPLSIVQSMIRVESARLNPEFQTMFSALVLEIERVRLNVEQEFREKFQLIRDIQHILKRAIEQLAVRATGAKARVLEIRSDLTQSLQTMQASHAKTRERDIRLSGVSRAVATETGRVVMSLQFYDAFTQKLQHTQRILGEMQIRGGSIPKHGKASCQALRFVQQSGQVCCAQIDEMTAGLRAAGVTVNRGIQGIVAQMTALDNDCITLSDVDSVSTGVNGTVQILLDSLKDVQRLVGEAAHFATESHATIEPIGGKTTNFTRFIDNLSFEIQLIGLNAEVQSTHIGKGTGLEVLSAQTSAISRETTEFSVKLAAHLDGITAGLREIVVSFQDIRERSIAFNQTLSENTATAEAALHAYRDSSLQVLLKISELLPELKKQTQTALAQADFVAIANGPLMELHAAVTELTAAAASAADRTGVQVETTGLTDHFLKFYTMSAEVDAHRKALGQVAPPAAPSAPASGDVDLFGPETSAAAVGDVELFGFDEPAPAPTAVTPPVADVDLWLDDPIPAPPEPSPVGCTDAATPSVSQPEPVFINRVSVSTTLVDRTLSEVPSNGLACPRIPADASDKALSENINNLPRSSADCL